MGNRVVPLLAEYLDMVSRIVSAHGGTIDKFIGDAVMAFWGAPAESSSHAVDACRAALACREAILHSGLVDDTGRALRIRIGINTGDMLVGNIGSEVRLNYTVIGDTVYVASRLEGANKQYGTQIIIGEETRRLAGDHVTVRELDRLLVYGRQGELSIYELLASADGTCDKLAWVASYERGLSAYRAREFAGALRFFEDALDNRSDDKASSNMVERCRALLATQPENAGDP
jgi:adenylate cyclase